VCGAGFRRADRGQAERDGAGRAVTTDDGDGVVDLGSLGVGKAYEVAVDSVDQLPDSSDLLLGGSGVGTSPFIETVDGSGQPFPGAQQIVEVAGQVW
jgi:hypothetical protein